MINRKNNRVWLSVVMGFIFSVSSAYGADLNTTAPQTSEGMLQKTVAPQEASEPEAQSAGSGAASVIPAGFQLEADNPLSPPDSMPEVSPSPSPTPKTAGIPVPESAGNKIIPLTRVPENEQKSGFTQQTTTTELTKIPKSFDPDVRIPEDSNSGGAVIQSQVTTVSPAPAPLPSENITNPEQTKPLDEPGVTRNDKGIIIKREIKDYWSNGNKKRELTETFDDNGELTSELEILYFPDGNKMEYSNTTFSGFNDLSGLPQPTYENKITYNDNGKKQEESITFYEMGLAKWEKAMVLEYRYDSEGRMRSQSAHNMEYYDNGELKKSNKTTLEYDEYGAVVHWEYRYEEYSRDPHALIRKITNEDGVVNSWEMPLKDLQIVLEMGDGGKT